jgi:hypothetical protein
MLVALLAGVVAFSLGGLWFVRRRVDALTGELPGQELSEQSDATAAGAPSKQTLGVGA